MTLSIFEPWILISLAAAAFQTVRFMLQKQLASGALSPAGATYARFVYALPFLAVLMGLYLRQPGVDLPQIAGRFWIFAVIGGGSQILATVCLVMLFTRRNFAVGVTFSKTEVIQTVLVGWLVLGDGTSLAGIMAMMLGVVGLVLVSIKPETIGWSMASAWNPSAGLGLLSGLLFSFSGVSYRGASLEVMTSDPLMRAAVTLMVVVTLQTLVMTCWLLVREPAQIRAVWGARRVAVWIGLTSMAGSFGWFLAFTLQIAAYVKAMGQVEVILSLFATTLFFKEKISGREWIGIGVLTASIVLLILVI